MTKRRGKGEGGIRQRPGWPMGRFASIWAADWTASAAGNPRLPPRRGKRFKHYGDWVAALSKGSCSRRARRAIASFPRGLVRGSGRMSWRPNTRRNYRGCAIDRLSRESVRVLLRLEQLSPLAGPAVVDAAQDRSTAPCRRITYAHAVLRSALSEARSAYSFVNHQRGGDWWTVPKPTERNRSPPLTVDEAARFLTEAKQHGSAHYFRWRSPVACVSGKRLDFDGMMSISRTGEVQHPTAAATRRQDG